MGFWMGTCLRDFSAFRSESACRHYYYRLVGEYAVPSTPKTGWFRSRHTDESNVRSGYYPSGVARGGQKRKKRLILSQSMVIDIDPTKVCLHLFEALNSIMLTAISVEK
jgi:hypothetical protein